MQDFARKSTTFYSKLRRGPIRIVPSRLHNACIGVLTLAYSPRRSLVYWSDSAALAGVFCHTRRSDVLATLLITLYRLYLNGLCFAVQAPIYDKPASLVVPAMLLRPALMKSYRAAAAMPVWELKWQARRFMNLRKTWRHHSINPCSFVTE